MSTLNKSNITSGYRAIQDGRRYDHFFNSPDDKDRVIIEDGEVEDTVDLMKRVVWKYIGDSKKISMLLKGNTLRETCLNIWNFLYNHIQYKLDKKGLEQLRRPNRSWSERKTGIDCDCFSIFVSSILTNLHIPHTFRITKYNQDVFQHVYVIVPKEDDDSYYTIDCVLSRFDYEKPFSENKDFDMNLEGINIAVLSGTGTNDVMDLVSGLEGFGEGDEISQLQMLYEHLVKTRNLIAENPDLISSVDYPPAFLKMLDYAIENWNTPNRDQALAVLAKNEDALNEHNGILGIDDPEMDGLDNEWEHLEGLGDDKIQEALLGKAKKPAKKGFFKKVGAALKKGGKAFMRINPVAVSARTGFLLALKLNIKKMASKLKWGYATKEQAAKKGVSATEWQKSKNALAKMETMFADKLQGTRKALRNAILKGKAGGIDGVDDEQEFNGFGVLPAAAAMAAAVPVIASALKILVDSGVMKQEEAQRIEDEIKSKGTEAEKIVNDPDIKEGANDTSVPEPSDATGSGSSGGGGIIGFVKKQPLVAAGSAALSIWGLSKIFAGRKSKGLSGVTRKHFKKRSKQHKRTHKKITAITLK